MKNKRINVQVLLEIICYLLFAGILLYTVISGKYLSYVTPRIKPYIFFAVIILVVWAIISVKSLFTVQYRKHTLHCLILIIPMILLLLPHAKVTGIDSTAGTGLLKGNSTNVSQPGKDISGSQTDTGKSNTENSNTDSNSIGKGNADNTFDTTDEYGNPLKLHGYDVKNKKITINNEEFMQWVNVLFKSMNDYVGWSITITGSVYKDPDSFAKNQFVPARLVMTCCIADLVPCGLVCEYDNVEQLKSNSWVTVTGEVFIGKYDGQDEPELKVTSISEAQAVEGYLYPY